MPTNYINQDDFKKIIDVVDPVVDANNNRGLGNRGPDPQTLKACLWSQYAHALRVSENLTLCRNDFNFKRGILTLNRTKTGFKKCKCSKWEKRKLIESDPNCAECSGIGKIRKPQFTSIPPDLPKWVIDYISNYPENKRLFPFNRQLILKYLKELCIYAGLDIGEQQEERYIEGAFTHILRKSRSKLMLKLGADKPLRMVKLRHKPDTQDRYDLPDINELIAWERENIK